MNTYLKITFRTFTIWILTSFINGLLSGTYISITNHYRGELPADTLFSFFISLFFSTPGFFIFWIILLVKLVSKIYGRALFRAALSTGFILATATALICSELLKSVFSTNKYVFILFAILSAMSGIMIHFNHFKKINNQA